MIRPTVACNTLAIGLLSSQKPAVDELLAVDGVSAEALVRWFDGACQQDALLAAARLRGVATNSGAPSSQTTLADGHVLMVALPESLREQRWWWVMLARDAEPFNEDEMQRVELLAQSWRAYFNRADERDMGRLLLGHDNRLIHADPATALAFAQNPAACQQIVDVLHPLVAQRWPDLADGAMGDFAIDVADMPCWIRFCRRRAVDQEQAMHWYIELRPLDPGELPTAGVVDDPRVARAIAYLHDHFEQSPNLSEIAQFVHISPFHFHRMFSKQVGVSPKHYLQAKQLQVAKWLLRSTRAPIGEIAAKAGFASHGHFTSTFHRVVGVSPSEYREKN